MRPRVWNYRACSCPPILDKWQLWRLPLHLVTVLRLNDAVAIVVTHEGTKSDQEFCQRYLMKQKAVTVTAGAPG
jgi:hypothetical protein